MSWRKASVATALLSLVLGQQAAADVIHNDTTEYESRLQLGTDEYDWFQFRAWTREDYFRGVNGFCEGALWYADTFYAESTLCVTHEAVVWQPSTSVRGLFSFSLLKEVEGYRVGGLVETRLGSLQIVRFENHDARAGTSEPCAGFALDYKRLSRPDEDPAKGGLRFYACGYKDTGLSDEAFREILDMFRIDGELDSLF
ncbi:MAG: hypothetical protein AAF563_12005 [Pseudomonadota bacterium]